MGRAYPTKAMARSLTDPWTLGGLPVPNRVVLAPLAGIGNWFVRLQARRYGAGLVVSGRAEDGVIEAIELEDGGWGLGVQWHPEANDRTRLFAALCDAARGAQRISKPDRPSGSSSRTSTLSTSA